MFGSSWHNGKTQFYLIAQSFVAFWLLEKIIPHTFLFTLSMFEFLPERAQRFFLFASRSSCGFGNLFVVVLVIAFALFTLKWLVVLFLSHASSWLSCYDRWYKDWNCWRWCYFYLQFIGTAVKFHDCYYYYFVAAHVVEIFVTTDKWHYWWLLESIVSSSSYCCFWQPLGQL